jgi:dUTP pyrophosphatase
MNNSLSEVNKINVVLSHKDAVLPKQSEGDVGFDVHSVEGGVIPPGKTRCINTGIQQADNPPSNHEKFFIKVEGRSGLALKGVFPVGGIVDPSYRGDIGIILYNSSDEEFTFKKGDRVAQLVIYPALATDSKSRTEFTLSDEQNTTQRGSKGFGSSGV